MAKKEAQNKRTQTFKFLPLTLRIETLGGIATPIVLRGTPLPAQRSQVFSTAADNQKRVEINALLGESPIAKNNIRVQTFHLEKLPKAARGEPQIRITFDVDEACHVAVSAMEKSSVQKVDVEFDDAQPHLTDEEIKHLLQQNEGTRAEDEKLLKLIEAKNRANSVIPKAEAKLREYKDENLTKAEYDKIEKALAELGLALDDEDAERIRTKAGELEGLVANPFDFLSLFGGGDGVFSTFFGAAQGTSSQRTSNRHGQSTDGQKIHEQLATSRKDTKQLGKIFGGGEFTMDSNLCFVLMPLDEEMHFIYEDHIRIVVESEDVSCLRADEIAGTNMITWDIWEKINRSRFLIADLTGKNPNVFYEVGVAHALGKEVILLTQTMDDVPFDLKSLRCIIYSRTPRGMKKMESKLRETIKKIIELS